MTVARPRVRHDMSRERMRPQTPNRVRASAQTDILIVDLQPQAPQSGQRIRTTKPVAPDTQPRNGHRQSQHPGVRPGVPTRQAVGRSTNPRPWPKGHQAPLRAPVRNEDASMHTPLQTTVIALLLTTASFSAQAQTTPPPEVIEPDGICAQITIPDPDNPAPATIEVNDETDPDCHTPGIIYQQADDTVIDATVETTGTGLGHTLPSTRQNGRATWRRSRGERTTHVRGDHPHTPNQQHNIRMHHRNRARKRQRTARQNRF